MAGFGCAVGHSDKPDNTTYTSVGSRPVDGIVISFSLELPHVQRTGSEAPGCQVGSCERPVNREKRVTSGSYPCSYAAIGWTGPWWSIADRHFLA